jgi:hypothetical protein
MDDSAYHVARVPAPKTAQTLVTFTNGSMAAGGVTISPEPFLADAVRAVDSTNALHDLHEQAQNYVTSERQKAGTTTTPTQRTESKARG